MKIEDKAYFAKPKMDDFTKNHLKTYIENRYRGKDKQKIYSEMLKVWEDNPEYWSNEGWPSVEKAAGFSMPVEDKRYFAISPAETEKKIRDLTAAWRKLMNVADNLHGMANPSPEIMKRQDQVDADMERIGNQIAELKKSIGVQENVSVRLAKPVEDKAYFDGGYFRTAATPLSLFTKDLRETLRRLAALAECPILGYGKLTTQSEFSSKINQLKTWITADIAKIEKDKLNEKESSNWIPNMDKWIAYRKQVIAELKKIEDTKISLLPTVAKNAMPVEDKAYFDRRIYHSTGTFQTKLDKETRVPIDGTSKFVTVDPAQYITPRRVRISGIKGEIEIAAQLSGDEIKGISAKTVKATAARQGYKVKMGFLSGTKKQQIDYVFGVGTNYGERAWKSGIKRLIDDKEALARIRLLKYELDLSSPMRNTVDKEFDKGWLKGYTIQQIQESENPPKFKKGDKVLYNTGTAKHIGTIEKVSPYAKPEAEYIVAFTTLSTGRSQLNIPESSISKSNASRTGTKAKFANRGAFAEASSSPVLGSLLEKKVMPEGGWRAVETDGAALVIAFEDGDIAGNFARRAAENGYSATAPMAMAGRFWNVKVQNENKN